MEVGRDSSVEIEYNEYIKSQSSARELSSVEGKKKFKMGTGQMNKQFENKLLGMQKEEEREFDLMLNKIDQHLVIRKKKSYFTFDEPPSQGKRIELILSDGKRVIGTILLVKKNDIMIDLNHPLAGKIIHFRIKNIEYLTLE